MQRELIRRVEVEEIRGKRKWGAVDRIPGALLNAATEELGEVAHAINHEEGVDKTRQEIAEAMGVLSRLWNMVGEVDDGQDAVGKS